MQVTTAGSISGQMDSWPIGRWRRSVQIGVGSLERAFGGGGNACGCTDASAVNYDASAEYDDGSCEYEVLGCTDDAACNYDSLRLKTTAHVLSSIATAYAVLSSD